MVTLIKCNIFFILLFSILNSYTLLSTEFPVLWELIKKNDAKELESLIAVYQKIFKEKFDINIKNSEIDSGNTMVHWAIKHKSTGALKVLLDAGIKIDVTNNLGETPLHLAVDQGFISGAMLLISYGALVNIIDSIKETALFKAIRKNHSIIVELLLMKGACINHKNRGNITPLYLAVQEQNINVLSELFKSQDLEIDQLNIHNQTAYQLAKEIDNNEILKLFECYFKNGATSKSKMKEAAQCKGGFEKFVDVLIVTGS